MDKAQLDSISDMSVDDSRLVARAKGGDLSAFEELVSRHERQVYTLAMRMLRNEHDAQDVTQEAFTKAIEHLGTFREESTFSTWLLRIATYAALKLIRKRKGLPTISLDEATDDGDENSPVPHPEYIADWKQSPAELVHQHETRALLNEALSELDEKHRLVFLLRDIEGLSIKQTAEAIGITEANVKVRLLRARLLLRERLTRSLGDPETRLAPHKHG